MPKLKNREIQKVIQLFENEMILIPRMSKIDRMKLRKRIVNVVQPALTSPIATPQIFMGTVEEKLSSVMRLFRDSYGFRVKLTKHVTAIFKEADKPRIPAKYFENADTEEIDS